MDTKLTKGQVRRITDGHCPDCNYRGFVLGPQGGSSINIECGNIECRKRFNVATIFDWQKGVIVVFCERIPSQAESGVDWTDRPQAIGERRAN